MSVAQPALPGAGITVRILRDDGVTYAGATLPTELFSPGAISAKLAAATGLSATEIARARNLLATLPHSPREPSEQGLGWAVYSAPAQLSAFVQRDDGTHLSWSAPAPIFSRSKAAGFIATTSGLSASENVRISALAGGSTVISAVGSSATAFTIAPTAQYHPNTAVLTMFGTVTVAATVTNRTMTIPANTGPYLTVGDPVIVGAFTTSVLKIGTGGSSVYGAQTGTFTLADDVGNIGSTPITYDPQVVTAMTDRSGNGFTVSMAGGRVDGPRRRVDASGRVYLKFYIPGAAFDGFWLRNLSITGLDTANTTWTCVGRFSGPGAVVGSGAIELGGQQLVCLQAMANNWPYCQGNIISFRNPTGLNKVLLGTQLQVYSSSYATDDGVGGASSVVAGQINHNENKVSFAASGRFINIAGLTVGKLPDQNPGLAASQYGSFDLYELTGWTTGQMGTRAQMPARVDAQHALAVANYAVPAITKSVVIFSDSRLVNGSYGMGVNFATTLTDPGAAYALPANYRVIDLAVSGHGVGRMWAQWDVVSGSNSNTTSPATSGCMLGSGNDYLLLMDGINDIQGISYWPTTSNGGTQAAGTAALADDLYNGPAYTASFTATVPANGSLTTAGQVGNLYEGSRLTISGQSAGLTVVAAVNNPTSPFTLNIFEAVAIPALTPGTGSLGSLQALAQEALTRGYNVRWAGEMRHGTSTPEDAATVELRSKVVNSAQADAIAALGSTLGSKLISFDLTQISVGGLKVLGADFTGYLQSDIYYTDNTHGIPAQWRLVAGGADTPQNGVVYALTH